ncbi:MAG: lipid A export permease/ATP-binding protein MsbA [Legionellaceae bacterium]|nr:lipid A export permease/ATP-binding protein MsbA [Legionellaceae bacterium]
MTRKTTAKSDAKLYIRLLGYIRPFWWLLLISFAADAAYSAIDSGFVYSLKPILDQAFTNRNTTFIEWLPVLILLAFILRALMNIIGSYTISYASCAVIKVFRRQLFARLMNLPATYYDQHSNGRLLSTIIYNVGQVSNASANALTTMAQSSFLAVGLLVVMFTVSWKLSIIYFVIAPFVMLAMRYSSKRMRRLSHSTQRATAGVTSIAEEAILGYKVVRAFGGEPYETKKFAKVTQKNFSQDVKISLTRSVSVSVIQFVSAIALAVIVYLALSKHVSLSAGSFAAMVGAMLGILKPLKNMTKVNSSIQRGLAGAESIFEMIDEPTEKDEGQKSLTRAKGKIEYCNTSFIYNRTHKKVLDEISFTVEPGQMVALVGRSGAGKTTLVNLLPRFYDEYTGEILLDGHNIKDYQLTDLRQQFSLVSQDVVLFNDTVHHNIAYGVFDQASEEDIIAAAKAANAWEFISKLPEGLQTEIGDNGVLLSGGQRQRIAIARAILKHSPILILDEATAALDTESERLIQQALDNLMSQSTSLVIAHRLSTIERADKIIVLDHGKIVESGTHKELLALNNHYAHLYRLQFNDGKPGEQSHVP